MIRSKVAALVRFAKTRAIPQGLQKSRGAEKVTGSAHISNIVRTLFFARGRSRRFDVSPTIRQARKLFSTYVVKIGDAKLLEANLLPIENVIAEIAESMDIYQDLTAITDNEKKTTCTIKKTYNVICSL